MSVVLISARGYQWLAKWLALTNEQLDSPWELCQITVFLDTVFHKGGGGGGGERKDASEGCSVCVVPYILIQHRGRQRIIFMIGWVLGGCVFFSIMCF